MMEYPFDTTRAAVNLAFGGALERFPRIRFVLAHAGGVLPFFAWRLSVAPMIDSRLHQHPPERIIGLFKRFWYDVALSPTPATMVSLSAVSDARADRVRQRLAVRECARDRGSAAQLRGQ